MSLREYNSLVDRIVEASKAYYDGTPEITDDEFDGLVKRALEMEVSKVEGEDHRSELHTPGWGAFSEDNESDKVDHDSKMLSLENVFTPEEAMGRAERFISDGHPKVLVEFKMDGMAISAKYKNGKCVSIASRGNGVTGENLNHLIGRIESIPKKVNIKDEFEIRGELVIRRSMLEKCNKFRTKQGMQPFKNCRNGAVGAARSEKIDFGKYLTFYVYEVFGLPPKPTKEKAMVQLANASHDLYSTLLESKDVKVEELPDTIQRMQEEAVSLDYDTDGLVIKSMSKKVRKKLGESSQYPKWAVAYKFAEPRVITKIESIDFQVGSKGRITPVANVEPVDCGGVTISRATLHNGDFIEEIQVGVGDTISLFRAKEVIPQVEKVITASSKPRAKMPKRCPQCDSPVVKDGVHITCHECQGSLLERILFAVTKKVLDFDGIGPNSVIDVYDEGLLKSFSDLFTVGFDELEPIIGPAKAEIWVEHANTLPKKLESEAHVWLRALNISGFGYTLSNAICAEWATDPDVGIRGLDKATFSEISGLEGIGDSGAQLVLDSMPAIMDLANELEKINILPYYELPEEIDDSDTESYPLANKRVAITGSFSVGRSEVQRMISSLGGQNMSFSGKADVFLIGMKPGGAKVKVIEKAIADGKEVYRENEAEELLGL